MAFKEVLDQRTKHSNRINLFLQNHWQEINSYQDLAPVVVFQEVVGEKNIPTLFPVVKIDPQGNNQEGWKWVGKVVGEPESPIRFAEDSEGVRIMVDDTQCSVNGLEKISRRGKTIYLPVPGREIFFPSSDEGVALFLGVISDLYTGSTVVSTILVLPGNSDDVRSFKAGDYLHRMITSGDRFAGNSRSGES